MRKQPIINFVRMTSLSISLLMSFSVSQAYGQEVFEWRAVNGSNSMELTSNWLQGKLPDAIHYLLISGAADHGPLFKETREVLGIETSKGSAFYVAKGKGLIVTKNTSEVHMTTSAVQQSEGEFPGVVYLFPNPAQDHFTLQFNGEVLNPVISLFTSNGEIIGLRQVSETRGETGLFEVIYDVSSLPEGLYLVAVTWANQRQVIKLIKSH